MNDRMKGLDKSLEQTFPNHHLNDCVQHIKANVQQKFGMKAASFVVSIARLFSTRQEEFLLEKLRNTNKAAHNYLMKILANRWRSSEWLQNDTLPPRFGIITSNTSESSNSMIDEYRNCLLYTSPSPRDLSTSRMPSSA